MIRNDTWHSMLLIEEPDSDWLVLISLHAVQATSLLPGLFGLILALGSAHFGGHPSAQERWLAGSSKLSSAELMLTAVWVSLHAFVPCQKADDALTGNSKRDSFLLSCKRTQYSLAHFLQVRLASSWLSELLMI